jgi:hypothetical protein
MVILRFYLCSHVRIFEDDFYYLKLPKFQVQNLVPWVLYFKVNEELIP